jgi:hypothetical protein
VKRERMTEPPSGGLWAISKIQVFPFLEKDLDSTLV